VAHTACLLLVAHILLEADLAVLRLTSAIEKLRVTEMANGAVGLHPVSAGRAVIGAAMGAAAVFMIVIAFAAGFAFHQKHPVPSFFLIKA
jgi:hypothetical protein